MRDEEEEDRSPDAPSRFLEYPRPQLRRPAWTNLNGRWRFTITALNRTFPRRFPQRIHVPFPVESNLSGVGQRVDSTMWLWYRKDFRFARHRSRRLLLHFEKVDYETVVYLNGQSVGRPHLGGYAPFSYDITPYLAERNQLLVRVWDPSNHGSQARGKQMLDIEDSYSIFYTPCSGIWGTVWLEEVPEIHIARIDYQTTISPSEVLLTYRVDLDDLRSEENPKHLLDVPRGERLRTRNRFYEYRGYHLKLVLSNRTNASILEFTTRQPHQENQINISRSLVELWSPEKPVLYDLRIELYQHETLLDQVSSYLAFRQITLCQTPRRICLNHQPYFMYGVLDQGYWPDGLYRPPSDQAYREDILRMKELGFNTLRKHMKVETSRWYYWCDVYGMLVWQDMPAGDSYYGFEIELEEDKQLRLHRDNRTNDLPTPAPKYRTKQVYRPQGRERSYQSKIEFEWELKSMIDLLSFHPSIVVWVLFNEEWGQYDTIRLAKWIEYYDPSRLIDAASGWQDRLGIGHIRDIHDYTRNIFLPPIDDHQRALVLGECGGFGLTQSGWSYNSYNDRSFLTYAFERLIVNLSARLSAMIYTQLSDVETESNGIVTYDRQETKFVPEHLQRVLRGDHSRLYQLDYLWNLTAIPYRKYTRLNLTETLTLRLSEGQLKRSQFYFYTCYLYSFARLTINGKHHFHLNRTQQIQDYHYISIPSGILERNSSNRIDVRVRYASPQRYERSARFVKHTFFYLSLARLSE